MKESEKIRNQKILDNFYNTIADPDLGPMEFAGAIEKLAEITDPDLALEALPKILEVYGRGMVKMAKDMAGDS